MCNLYRVEAYPDRPAPVVRNGESGRELVG